MGLLNNDLVSLERSEKKTLFLDIFFIVILYLISIFFISFYNQASFITAGYPDWLVHAFRVKILEESGLASWSHFWSNGISIWKSYQFLPHFITLGVSNFLQVDIPRAMVIITILLYIITRLSIYLSLRLLNFSPITSFLCTMLSFDIAQYWGGVADFSLLFGFTIFPITILFWSKFLDGKFKYLFPYLAGLLFYFHPLLGISTLALWFIGIIFSKRKLNKPLTIYQVAIFLASSSLFWVPIIFKEPYTYSSAVYASKYFLSLAIGPYQYLGLSIFLMFCLSAAFINLFILDRVQFRWIKLLFLFAIFYLLLVVAGTTFELPRFISQFQFTRGATFIGIAIIFVFAPVVESLIKLNSNFTKGIFVFIVSLALVEGIWFTSIYSPWPAKKVEDPIQKFSQEKNLDLSDGRIWSSTIDTSSYFPPSNYRLPYSYMNHLGSNQVSQRVPQLIVSQPNLSGIPDSSISRINDYFKITGVKYAFFEEFSPFTKTFSKTETVKSEEKTSNDSESVQYKDIGKVDLINSSYRVFEVPWQTKDAVLITDGSRTKLKQFPIKLEVNNQEDQVELDKLVSEFTDVVFKPENQTLPISYPTQESIAIKIPEDRSSNYVYINESFDSNWKAFLNQKEVSVSSIGPNFMLVDLKNVSGGGDLILKHNWPLTFYISLFFIFLIPLEMILLKTSKKIWSR